MKEKFQTKALEMLYMCAQRKCVKTKSYTYLHCVLNSANENFIDFVSLRGCREVLGGLVISKFGI